MINKINVIGNLFENASQKTLPNGTPIVTGRLAVNRFLSSEKRQAGQTPEVDSIKFEFLGETAGKMAQFLVKGKSLQIKGRVRKNKWQDQQEQWHSELVVSVEKINFLSAKDAEKQGNANDNDVTVIGRLAEDPELRMVGDLAICEIVIGVNRRKTKAQRENNMPADVDWLPVTILGKAALNANEYLQKGSLVGVDAELRTESWVGDDEKRRYSQKLLARYIDFLGSPRSAEGNGVQNNGSYLGQEISFPDGDSDDLPF